MNHFSSELEVECRVLGASMENIDWLNEAISKLKEYHFSSSENRLIFSTMRDLAERDIPVGVDAIIEILGHKKIPVETILKVRFMGGSGFDRNELFSILNDFYMKRRLRELCVEYAAIASNKEGSSDSIVRSLEEKLFSLTQGSGSKTMINVQETLITPKPFMKMIEERQENFRAGRTGYVGFPTHFYDLDSKIKGLTPGHFTIIGARPGVGKTTFALNLIEQLCFKSQGKCLLFSLEMPSSEIIEKLIAQTAEIPLEKIKEGNVSGHDYQRILSATKAWESKVLICDDQAALGIDQLKARAIRAKRAHGINAIFIDYIQLVTSNVKEARHLQVADISRRCKEIAKELNVPVIGLAQLNREVEKRDKKEPYISDLRESGSLEADADEILLLHRPEMYAEHEKPGLMQVIIAKNRFGETGALYLAYDKKCGVLRNYSFKQPSAPPPIEGSAYDNEYFRN